MNACPGSTTLAVISLGVLVGYAAWRSIVWIWGEVTVTKKPSPPTVPAPCGRQQEHDYWKSLDWPCPVCVALRNREVRAKNRGCLVKAGKAFWGEK